MSGIKDVGVIGAALWPSVEGQARSLEEILFDITHAALRDAGLGIDDIDGIVVASNDQYDGRAISVMAASGSVGGVDRDILSTPSAGEHAFVMGALRVASGQYRTQLVLAWSPLETDDLEEVQRLAADPYYHRRLPLNEPSSDALQATVVELTPGAAEAAWAVVAKNRANGAAAYPDLTMPADEQPMHWPLVGAMLPPPTSGVVALVLASRAFIGGRADPAVAWVHGLGWATESSYLGDRDLGRLPSLEAAAAQAYGAAGITDPTLDFDVAEVADGAPHHELLAYQALGLSAPKDWVADLRSGRFAVGGAQPINPSGGALSFNPVFCAGLMRIAEAANQVRGRAGGHQIEGVKRGLGHAASGFAMQYNTVVVFGDQAKEATP